MTLTFDQTTYPQAIETEAEYERLLKVTERLVFAKNLSP